MNIIQCSICRRPAAWMIDGDLPCVSGPPLCAVTLGGQIVRLYQPVDKVAVAFAMFLRADGRHGEKHAREEFAKLSQLDDDSMTQIALVPASLLHT